MTWDDQLWMVPRAIVACKWLGLTRLNQITKIRTVNLCQSSHPNSILHLRILRLEIHSKFGIWAKGFGAFMAESLLFYRDVFHNKCGVWTTSQFRWMVKTCRNSSLRITSMCSLMFTTPGTEVWPSWTPSLRTFYTWNIPFLAVNLEIFFVICIQCSMLFHFSVPCSSMFPMFSIIFSIPFFSTVSSQMSKKQSFSPNPLSSKLLGENPQRAVGTLRSFQWKWPQIDQEQKCEALLILLIDIHDLYHISG